MIFLIGFYMVISEITFEGSGDRRNWEDASSAIALALCWAAQYQENNDHSLWYSHSKLAALSNYWGPKNAWVGIWVLISTNIDKSIGLVPFWS